MEISVLRVPWNVMEIIMDYKKIIKKDFRTTRDELLECIGTVDSINCKLNEAYGRILAEDFTARISSPPFDRSPYDGYALIASDTRGADQLRPAELNIVYETKAGDKAGREIVSGEAVKILTGAPIPPGADCVIMYEKTDYDKSSVRIFSELKAGENIIRAGEDVLKGSCLINRGSLLDSAEIGLIASQGVDEIKVYKKLSIGIISTGNEVIEPGQIKDGGKIYNSNRYMLECEILKIHHIPVYLGQANDDTCEIANLVREGVKKCDCIILTGGVSAGDYDLVPEAMLKCSVNLRVYGIDMKPGMACAYGFLDGKLIAGLSGNPASCMTNYYGVVKSCIKKMSGLYNYTPGVFDIHLLNDFNKKSPLERLLRGKLRIIDGKAFIDASGDQGNVVISSMIENDCMAIVPKGSGKLLKGELLKGFII